MGVAIPHGLVEFAAAQKRRRARIDRPRADQSPLDVAASPDAWPLSGYSSAGQMV